MPDDRPTVTVSGLGTAATPPDQALLSVSAETRASDPGAALSDCSAAAAAMVDAALLAGLARSAVQTSGLSLQPQWHQGSVSRVTGYVASTGLRLTVHPIERTGPLVTAVVEAGGEAARVNGVSLLVGCPEAVLRSARREAFLDAKGKAEQYADLAGAALGVLLRLDEGDGGSQRGRAGQPIPMAAHRSAALAVEPGESELPISVTATWELLPAD